MILSKIKTHKSKIFIICFASMVYLHLFVNGTILLHRPGFCNRSFPTQYNKNFFLLFSGNWCILSKHHAGVMELVDVVDSKSTAGDSVPVRVRPPAPNQYNPNQIFPVGNGFGLFVYFKRYEQEYFPNGAPIRPDSKPRGPRKKKHT